MPEIRLLSASDVRSLLDPEKLRAALEAALVAQSEGRADVPPRIAAVAPNGLLAAMPGYLSTDDGGRLATKLVAVFPGNVDVPSHQGIITWFDADTGTPLAVMDAEVITEDRTAITAAIGADLLARSDSEVLAVVGAGAQGRAHIEAFRSLRPWTEIRIAGRNPARAEALAHAAGATAVASPEGAVRGADVVALCTHADKAVIDPGWVGAGTHVSSVGSAAELPVELVGAGPLVVDQLGAITTPPPSGAAELQGVDPADAVELGALIAGAAEGRTTADQITVYKSTGHAVQDLAAAGLVFVRAVAADVGLRFAI